MRERERERQRERGRERERVTRAVLHRGAVEQDKKKKKTVTR